MRRDPNPPETPKAPNFPGFQGLLEQFVRNELPINRVQALAQGVKVSSHPETWVSSATTDEQGTHIKIGEKALPADMQREFRWGAETKEQQYVVKFAHEYAHVVQEMFDADLLRWLDGADNIPQESAPYIQLYALLVEIGGLHGLSQLRVYHDQTRSAGNLDVTVYEDMAETIGSFLLGTEYFLHRIQHARTPISQQQAEALVEHVMAVARTWEARSGR